MVNYHAKFGISKTYPNCVPNLATVLKTVPADPWLTSRWSFQS